jgi:hypothetical protein
MLKLARWWESIDPQWRQRFVEGWQAQSYWDFLGSIQSDVALSLTALNLDETVPVPELALAWPSMGEQPADQLGQTLQAIPYEWGEASGWLAPRLYNAVVPCWSESGGVSVLASREILMAELAGAMQPGEPVQATFALHLSWGECVDQVASLARHALKLGLLPGEDERSLNTRLQPWLNCLRRLGTLQLTAEPGPEGTLVVRGQLAAGATT